MIPSHVPADLVVDFDVYDHSLAADLQANLAKLRDATPIAYTERSGGHWILTRYDDILAVLKDYETFSSFPTAVPRSIHENTRMIPIAYDPPEHTAYREMIAPRFTPQRMRELEDGIRSLTISLIDDFADKGSCEFVADFARPLPSTVFLILMGWPLEDAAQFNRWSHDILLGKPGGTPEESDAARGAATMELFGYFSELIEDRRANPGDDFTSELVHGNYSGERPLDQDELLRMIMLLMLGGLHTVQSSLSYSIIELATRDELRRQVVEDPGRLNHVVEEMLRWEAPAWPSRRALRDTSIGGVDIKFDDMILLAFTAANHDAGEFAEPDAIDLDRHPNRHLTFSAGPHRCVGSHLARLEMRIAFEELHRRVPNYRLDPDHPPVRHLSTVNGVEHIHLRWD
jgi:cytochrome P450